MSSQPHPPPHRPPYEVDADVDEAAHYATESYQSGSLATQQQQQRYDAAPSPFQAPISAPSGPSYSSSYNPTTNHLQPDQASYLTSSGVNVETLLRIAWVAPPFSAVGVLIFETSNDLARFHAYQSALCGVGGVVLLYILRSWFGWYTFAMLVSFAMFGSAFYAGSIAVRAAPSLSREPYLPYIGPLAEDWVGGE